MDFFTIIFFVIKTTTSQILNYIDEENTETVGGLVQGSVKLRCRGATTFDPFTHSVYWYDTVYNTDENPILIFSSINNTDFNPNPNHPKSAHYLIDFSDFSLTISSLDLDNDPGCYFCVVELDGNVTFRQSYDLTIFGPPECKGEFEVTENVTVELTCLANHSGKLLPKLRWFKEENIMKGRSSVEVRRTTEVVSFTASSNDNQVKHICQMTYGNGLVEECEGIMKVQFFVRDLTIEPNKRTFFVKEEIKCSARGNPPPKVYFGTASVLAVKGITKSKSLQIQSSWADQVRKENEIKDNLDKVTDQTYLVLTAIIVGASVLLVLIFVCVVVKKRQKRKLNRTAHMRKEPVRV
ncbi:hypothetical protein HELRODRAFT_164759 [Helobdella robusta]|uniref:Ig-like domain-containing protein n=1 Tax=Helobdella robusta TaxID=6412 RepID=T1EVS1_HELRO|nr:hypothetical protein HELRODRAFT_164759 [Helobdella robusta]ESN92675.1 hypothetical protein HELRODRAFT_164759 [Helobdella robusta]